MYFNENGPRFRSVAILSTKMNVNRPYETFNFNANIAYTILYYITFSMESLCLLDVVQFKGQCINREFNDV
jgi:hypothetical protein